MKWGGPCGRACHAIIPVAGTETRPWPEMRPHPGDRLRRCGRVAEGCWMWGRGGQAPPASPAGLPAPHFVLCPPPDPQSMEKAAAPSVTLIVGCGVSSLTLLMLIIIYVSVWR